MNLKSCANVVRINCASASAKACADFEDSLSARCSARWTVLCDIGERIINEITTSNSCMENKLEQAAIQVVISTKTAETN